MIGIRDESRPRFGRQVLTLWSGGFMSDYEGSAVELPNHDGFMLAIEYGPRIRVTCPAPRTDDNWQAVDAALESAFNAAEPHRCAYSVCRVALVPAPDHPGTELGDWFVHPYAGEWDLTGHTAALMVPRDSAVSA